MYGRCSATYGSTYAHRVAFGPTPLDVLHKCDNPPCCNPAHLFAGTNDDNVRDKVQKGRQHRPIGRLNGRAKLTDEQIDEAGRRAAAGENVVAMAPEFGVHWSTLYMAFRRARRLHLARRLAEAS
jgi:hypothetical protein